MRKRPKGWIDRISAGWSIRELRESIKNMNIFVPRLGIANGGIGRISERCVKVWKKELRRKKQMLISAHRREEFF